MGATYDMLNGQLAIRPLSSSGPLMPETETGFSCGWGRRFVLRCGAWNGMPL